MDADSRDSRQIATLLRVLVGLVVIAIITFIVLGFLITAKVERMTKVTEDLDQKMGAIMAAGAPLGHAAVDKGVKVLENMDTTDLGKSATSGAKDLGTAAKAAAEKWLQQHAATQP
jgi:ABC-type protease/lipase transport system fused ATPase/permease subunit